MTTSTVKFDSRQNHADLMATILKTAEMFGVMQRAGFEGEVASCVADNPAQQKTPASPPSSEPEYVGSVEPGGALTRDPDFIQNNGAEVLSSISEEMIPIYRSGPVGSVDKTCDLLASVIQKFKAGETNVFTVIWAAIKYSADHPEYGQLPDDIVGMHEWHRGLLADGVRMGEISTIESRQPHLEAIADGIATGEIKFLEVDGPALVLVT